MSRMSYEEAVERGYDGPSPFEERRHRNRVMRNNMLDCRDPDHDSSLCPHCGETDEEDEPEQITESEEEQDDEH